jgi:murein endopeptidase/LysM repeat protein
MNAHRVILGLALVAIATIAPGIAWAADARPEPATVVVKKGDTLVSIAARNKVAVDDLRRLNRGRIGKGDLLKPGVELVLRARDKAEAKGASGAPKQVGAEKVAAKAPVKPSARAPVEPPPGMWEDTVLVRKGDTLTRIAKRVGVELELLVAWNGFEATKGAPRIRAGERLRVFRPGPRPVAQSVGRVASGTLEFGQHLGDGPGYRLRFPRNAYGVEGMLKTLKTCAKRVKDTLPGSHDILIGDLSRPGGGRFPPHQGHQSGREADVGYYLASMQQNATLHRVEAQDVDVPRTWALMKCFLAADEVVRMYIDRKIQVRMVEWLRGRRVIGEEDIARLFEVVGGGDALIRHAKKHDTHIHVRFGCDAGQARCVEDDRDTVFKF